MPKKDWNTFVSSNPNAPGFAAQVSKVLPKQVPKFDRNSKRLPTPYGLFQEWLTTALQGDWAATSVSGGFIVCVSSPQDEQLIRRTFGPVSPPQTTPACKQTSVMSFHDANYGDLARKLGYAV